MSDDDSFEDAREAIRSAMTVLTQAYETGLETIDASMAGYVQALADVYDEKGAQIIAGTAHRAMIEALHTLIMNNIVAGIGPARSVPSPSKAGAVSSAPATIEDVLASMTAMSKRDERSRELESRMLREREPLAGPRKKKVLKGE